MKKNKILENIFLILAILVGAFMLLTKFYPDFKYGLYIVKSGSMSPKISIGSIIIDKEEASYKKSDIITFKNDSRVVTHRIINKVVENKKIKYKTKGDANTESDLKLVNKEDILGKVVLVVPFLGYFFIFIKTNLGIFLFVIIPAIFIIFFEIKSLLENKNVAEKIKKSSFLNFFKK